MNRACVTTHMSSPGRVATAAGDGAGFVAAMMPVAILVVS